MKLPIITFSTQDDLSQMLVRNLEKSIHLAGIDHPLVKTTCDLQGNSGYDSESYWKILRSKADNIYRVLGEFEQVLFVDNDIVFLKNDMSYLESLLDKYDLITGSDFPSHRCFISGFFFITKKHRHIFHPEITCATEFNHDNSGDQGILNEYLKNETTRVFMLSPTEYCNGWMWYNFRKSLNPVCVHYNWSTSLCEKIERMKKDGYWFIE